MSRISTFLLVLAAMSGAASAATHYAGQRVEFGGTTFPSSLPYEAYKATLEGTYRGKINMEGLPPVVAEVAFHDRRVFLRMTYIDGQPIVFQSYGGECALDTLPATAASVTTMEKKLEEGGAIDPETVELHFPIRNPEFCGKVFQHREISLQLGVDHPSLERRAFFFQATGLTYGPPVSFRDGTTQYRYVGVNYLMGQFTRVH